MPNGDRNFFAALGLIAGISIAFNIVGYLSVGFDWVGLQKAATNTYTYAEQQCARQQAQHTAQAAPAIQEGQDVPSADPQPGQGDGREDREPDWCDLAAQQSMADATFGMEQAAWVALFLTAVGVALVWGTLYYTRETLKEAQNTATITREIGEAQVRAYLTLEKPEVETKVRGDRVSGNCLSQFETPANRQRGKSACRLLSTISKVLAAR